MYGPESEALVYTYYNIGICYLALGVADKAEVNYLNALNLMNLVKNEDASQNEELFKDDRMQLADIY